MIKREQIVGASLKEKRKYRPSVGGGLMPHLHDRVYTSAAAYAVCTKRQQHNRERALISNAGTVLASLHSRPVPNGRKLRQETTEQNARVCMRARPGRVDNAPKDTASSVIVSASWRLSRRIKVIAGASGN